MKTSVKIFLYVLLVVTFFVYRASSATPIEVQCMYSYMTYPVGGSPSYEYKSMFGVLLVKGEEFYEVDFSRYMKRHGLIDELNPGILNVSEDACVIRGGGK